MKKLGFGLMRLPTIGEEIDIDQINKMVDEFISSGFFYFDTAYMYMDHRSEKVFKTCVKDRYPRDKYTITTKMPLMMLKNKEDVDRIFNEQLENCGVDYFDIYLLHHVCSHSIEVAEKFDCFQYIVDKKNEGKVKHIGFSYHDTPELLDKILEKHPEVEYVQLQINYLDWENEGIASRKCYEVCEKYGKKVIVMEPLKGGTLANVADDIKEIFKKAKPDLSIASWGIRYAASLEKAYMVLSGMSTLEQMTDNLSYMKDFKPLNDDEYKVIDAVVDKINSTIEIPCTACGYCLEGCPRNIPIPKYFALYNIHQQKLSKGNFTQNVYYGNISKNYGKASDCIKCKKCERICPQHIKITDYLVKVAKAFETQK